MGARYLPAAWDTNIGRLKEVSGPPPGRNVGTAVLKLLLVNLAEHASNEGGECWAGMDTISRETGLDQRTVRAGHDALVHLQLLARIDGSRRQPSVWRLLLPPAGR